MPPVYLDNNATTPLHPYVADAMRPFLGEIFGNPSSSHVYGRQARSAVREAREHLARLLGCSAPEIVFTSGGSEADNLALVGMALGREADGGVPGHIVVSSVEHPAVVAAAAVLASRGWRISAAPVGPDGRVRSEAVEDLIESDTVLVSIMHANNETGAVNPITEIAAVCRDRGVPFHTDAAQSAGKIPVDVEALGVDLLTVAAHKFHGPKGVGALYVREGVRLEPVVPGGGQERGLRAGTENLVGIAGMGAAAELAVEEGLGFFETRVRAARDRLHRNLVEAVPDLVLNGSLDHRLPNTLNVAVPGLRGADVLESAAEVAASTGSACHEGEDRPSAVLAAMGVPGDVALGAMRLSLGLLTTDEDVASAGRALSRAIRGLRR